MTGNNGMGYNMNLVPQGYADGSNGGMFGGNWMWFLLVWMAMFGWGNGGFGFGGNNGGGYVGSEVQRGFDQSAVINGINGIQTGMCNGFAGVNQSISNGFAQAEISANSRQMADMNQNFQLMSATQQGFCDQRAGLADIKYAIAQGNRDVMENDNRNHQAEMDKLCQLEMDTIRRDYEGQLRVMQSQNTALQSENQALRFAASQGNQTATLQSGQRALASEIEQYVLPTPRPAYIVQNPNCCAPNFGYGGCGGYAA